MTLNELHRLLADRPPIEHLPLNWDETSYTSETFNRDAELPEFYEWPGEFPTQEETRIIAELLSTQKGDSLLDIACGFGRHALPLTKEYGLNVTGIDISPGLIHRARKRAEEQHLEIDFQIKQARDLSWQDKFDHTMIVYNSFSLFFPKDVPRILKFIHQALHPRGRFFIDLDNKAFNCRYGTSDSLWTLWNGGLVFGEIYFHEDISVEVSRDITFKRDSDQMETYICLKRIYTRDEICDLLSTCGFKVERLYGNWDLSPLEESSPKMLLMGVKV